MISGFFYAKLKNPFIKRYIKKIDFYNKNNEILTET